MLVIKRKTDEIITIRPMDGVDTSKSIAELFGDGGIEIRLLEVGRNQVKIAIEAPRDLKIWRGEEPSASDSPDKNAA